MRNLLTLHEAIILVLVKEPDRTATFDKIATEIEKRHLFPERKGGIPLSKQIKLRTAISSSKYKDLFRVVSENEIQFI